MKPWGGFPYGPNDVVWTEPADFPLKELQHRVICVHLDSAELQQRSSMGAWRNDAELLAAQNLNQALMELGLQGTDIMLLAAYALQADSIDGISVSSSQGSENVVVTYTIASYAPATDASARQSLRGDIINTAMTRAKSLCFIVGDIHG